MWLAVSGGVEAMTDRLARTLDYILMQGPFDPEKLNPVQKRRQLAVVSGLVLAVIILVSLP